MIDVIKHRFENGSVYEKEFLDWYMKHEKGASAIVREIHKLLEDTGMNNAEKYGCLEFMRTIVDFS